MKTLKLRNLTVCFAASFLLATLVQVPLAAAHTHHSDEICSANQPAVCAHLGYELEPNASDEWKFMLHFQSPTLDSALLSNVAVKLWMDMGHHSHGSSPVTVTQKDPVHFLVEEAYFPMRGPWQIKVNYSYDGQSGELVIPVIVK
jgi:hypothetical protein